MFPFASLLAIALVFVAVSIVIGVAIRLGGESLAVSIFGGVSIGLLIAAVVAVVIIAVTASMKAPPFLAGSGWFAAVLGLLVAGFTMATGSRKRVAALMGGATALSCFTIASAFYVI